MHLKHKIVIKKRDYTRPKRLFYHGQKTRMIYPYLNKKDDLVQVISPEEHIEVTPEKSDVPMDTLSSTEGVSRQAGSTSVEDTDHALLEENHQDDDTNIYHEKKYESSDSLLTPTQIDENSESQHNTNKVKPNVHAKTMRTAINSEKTESKKQHKSTWMSYLPKILMGSLVGLLLGILLMSFLNRKQPEMVKKEEVVQTVEQSINKNMNNVVSVTNLQKAEDSETIDPESAVKPPEEVGIGTGVVYKLDKKLAYILTNYHVVGKANAIEVTYGEQKEKAKMIGHDVWTDMAVLTIPKGKLKTTIEMADSKHLQPGQEVIAMGSPLGKMFAGSVSSGIISSLSRNVPVDIDGDEIYDWEMNVLQTDAAINPGNSGGPLLNQQGEMIGLNSMKISMDGVEGIAFSIPSNDVNKVLKELEQNGSIKRPKMGIMIEDIGEHSDPNDPNSPTNKSGVEVMDVEPNSLAEKNGLLLGDIIKKIDGKEVKSKIHFRKILFHEKKIGDTITIMYERNGVKKEVKVTL
ncbi:S1C family serine protease [Macrococcus animalis]|uniref:S1C family serine protease n=1 Tax=Macrococcus animalis TaxID=3395467 RepID=UPI0039BEB95F